MKKSRTTKKIRLRGRIIPLALAIGVLGSIASQIPSSGGVALADDYDFTSANNNNFHSLSGGSGVLTLGATFLGKLLAPSTSSGSQALAANVSSPNPITSGVDQDLLASPQALVMTPNVPYAQMESLAASPGSTVSVSTAAGQVIAAANQQGVVVAAPDSPGDDAAAAAVAPAVAPAL